MTRYPDPAVTAKTDANFVRALIEGNGSLFHKIEQENDLGVDAIIEVVTAGQPTGDQVAVQIKSGRSYFDSSSETCRIPIGEHREYWARYPLPLLGIVFVPDLAQCLAVKLVADEGVDAPIVEGLRAAGHDIYYVAEEPPRVTESVRSRDRFAGALIRAISPAGSSRSSLRHETWSATRRRPVDP